MSQITRVPLGLQDLLGSKNFGDNPSELAQVVAPVLDVSKFLSIERRRWWTDGVVRVAANSQFAAVRIPDGELWLIEAFSLALDIGVNGAGLGADFSVQAAQLVGSDLPAENHCLVGWPRYEPATTAGTFPSGLHHDVPEPYFLQSGTDIRFFATQFTGAPAEFDAHASVRYIRLTT